jgi:hypothetical protein
MAQGPAVQKAGRPGVAGARSRGRSPSGPVSTGWGAEARSRTARAWSADSGPQAAVQAGGAAAAAAREARAGGGVSAGRAAMRARASTARAVERMGPPKAGRSRVRPSGKPVRGPPTKMGAQGKAPSGRWRASSAAVAAAAWGRPGAAWAQAASSEAVTGDSGGGGGCGRPSSAARRAKAVRVAGSGYHEVGAGGAARRAASQGSGGASPRAASQARTLTCTTASVSVGGPS